MDIVHGWDTTEAGWRAGAVNATVSLLTITSTAVLDYWLNTVESRHFLDPGQHAHG